MLWSPSVSPQWRDGKHDHGDGRSCAMPHTVLMVDDNVFSREAIATMLRKIGHRVFCAADGHQALDMLEDHWPDVVLLDLALPRLNGLDWLKTVRQMPAWKDLPVILFTGSGDARELVEGLGVAECLVKSHASVKQIHAAIARAPSQAAVA